MTSHLTDITGYRHNIAYARQQPRYIEREKHERQFLFHTIPFVKFAVNIQYHSIQIMQFVLCNSIQSVRFIHTIRYHSCNSHIHTDQLRAGSSINPQISSATNATCNSNSNVTYFGIMLTVMNSGRGWHSPFFC